MFGWGWGFGAGRRCEGEDVDFGNDVDLDLERQMRDALTDEQRVVDGILRQAGDRRRLIREKGRVKMVRDVGMKRREKVECRNRDERVVIVGKGKVLLIEDRVIELV
jgi:hypothetical protein